jgi:hypothetical protein
MHSVNKMEILLAFFLIALIAEEFCVHNVNLTLTNQNSI